ncbi:hypothetical protein SCHIN_v1c10050 [Spiroplasma chinense]|uniref:Transmembrane protein n=1 Tax=Spiroplasma chinense TaxID=216932 RepID=A0A5B9Y4V6_9MOLU|nr:hypothetical protein [Spiroplasma chinense]QEH62198.1 hypothetical protein SCHIN_v1c10050 [Spiroplasma chinense]
MRSWEIQRVKFWVVFANIVGLIIASIAAVILFYTFVQATTIGIEGVTNTVWSLIFAISAFAIAANIAACSFIINFTKKSDDATFSNNRYILVLFSLSSGGIFTPFILMRMPNVDVRTSINPKIVVSKGYGIIALSSAIVGFATFTIFNAATSNLSNLGSLEGTQSTALITSMAIFGVFLFWGILNCALFIGKTVDETSTEVSGFRNFIAIINFVIATITLIWIIINSISTIISAISDTFNRRSGFLSTMFNSMLLGLRIAMQMFIIYTAWHCIKGIWSKKGEFEYGQYQRLSDKQAEYQGRF